MKLCQCLSVLLAGMLLFFGTGIVSAATGSISGTVYGEDGVTPVTGDETIRVALFDHDFWGNPDMEVSVNPTDGTYVLEGLSSGQYDLRVLAQNYIDTYWTAEGSVNYRHQLETITLQEDEQVTGIDFQLTPGTVLAGTAYSTDGTSPIDGTLNDIGICAHVKGSCDTQWEFCSQVGSDGTYAIKLPSETLFFSVFSEDYIPEWWAADGSVRDCADAQPIDISEGFPVSGIDFQLEKGVMVSGTVFHGDGVTPITEDQLIWIGFSRDDPCLNEGGTDFSSGPINTDGTFSSLVEPGTYYLDVSAQNYVDGFWASPASVYSCSDAQMITVEADESITGLDFQLEPGNIISGTVYAPGGTEPLVNQEYLGIEITTQDPCAIDYNTSAEYFTFVDTSFGTWSVHVLDGTYYILLNTGSDDTNQFWAEPISVSTMDCDQAQALTVSGNNSYSNINFNKTSSSEAEVFILTADAPDLAITRGSIAFVSGTAVANSISLESGASAELINFPGQNSIQIQSSSDLFTVSRSGTMVTFQGSDGTVLKMPATTDPQTIIFTGEGSRVLQIHNGQVLLDDQVITTTAASIEGK